MKNNSNVFLVDCDGTVYKDEDSWIIDALEMRSKEEIDYNGIFRPVTEREWTIFDGLF